MTINNLKQLIAEAVQSGLSQQKEQDEFFTIEEASRYLKIPVTTLYDYTSNKRIPFHKKGKKLHFSKLELIVWMKSKTEKGGES